jgi:hypothetical protein
MMAAQEPAEYGQFQSRRQAYDQERKDQLEQRNRGQAFRQEEALGNVRKLLLALIPCLHEVPDRLGGQAAEAAARFPPRLSRHGIAWTSTTLCPPSPGSSSGSGSGCLEASSASIGPSALLLRGITGGLILIGCYRPALPCRPH